MGTEDLLPRQKYRPRYRYQKHNNKSIRLAKLKYLKYNDQGDKAYKVTRLVR